MNNTVHNINSGNVPRVAQGPAAITSRRPMALIMAGGTGGHIFPGLAVARALREAGWQVHWLGAPASMEERIVTAQGLDFSAIGFAGVRGKGLWRLLQTPLQLLRAIVQARAVLRRVRADVVLGMGGYITVPGGLAAALCRVPLLLHEQNSVPGMANRLLARVARQVFTAFPNVLGPSAQWVGNPLRAEFLGQSTVQERFEGRSGPLRLLVVGGSLGAQALNDTVPQALALLPEAERPNVIHQSGEKHIDALHSAYARAGVRATLVPFIEDMAGAFAQADLILCRAGASTVTEIAAVGAAAMFVPFPHAVDDHQSANARFLSDQGAAWLLPQSQLTAEGLAQQLRSLRRDQLRDMAGKAHTLRQTGAVRRMTEYCNALWQQQHTQGGRA